MESFSPQTSVTWEVSTAVASDEHDTPFDEFDRSQLFAPVNFSHTIYYGQEQAPIVTVMKINSQLYAVPCTDELLRNCRQLFPDQDRTMKFSIAQMYSGMIYTAPNSIRDGETGEAFQIFLDWETLYSPIYVDLCAARVAKMLLTTVSVRTDGAHIEHTGRDDLDLKTGTLHSLTQNFHLWRMVILWDDFSTPGVKFGSIDQLLACLAS